MEFKEVRVRDVTILVGADTDGSRLSLPTAEFIRLLHKKLIIYCKNKGLTVPPDSERDEGALDYFQDKLLAKKYPDDKLKCTIKIAEEIIYEISCRHPFSDGNKRTALLCASIMLTLNMETFAWKDPGNRKYSVNFEPRDAIEKGRMLEQIAKWNEDNCPEELKEFLIQKGIKIRKKVAE